MEKVTQVTQKIKQLYALVKELEGIFPKRKFTLDGHLIGSIGEVYAAESYKLELYPASKEKHDAKTADGKLVQIKATQKKSVGMRSCPDFLLVIKINPDAINPDEIFTEIYNGPGENPWNKASEGKPKPNNGQYSIQISTLSKLMSNVHESEKIPTKLK